MAQNNQVVKILVSLSLISLTCAFLILFVKPLYIVAFLAILFALLFFTRYLTLGFYLIVLLYPFVELQVTWGEINIPYVDLIALIVFCSWLISLVKNRKISLKFFPGLIFFILFLTSSFLSLINAPDFWFSLKYIFRPLGFFYLMFVILPFNIIKDQKILQRVLYIFYGLGIFTSLMGLASLFIVPAADLLSRRVVPFSLFGLNLLGSNHNQIAEVLVTIIPLGFFLIFSTKNELTKKLLILGTGLMVLINLLTFSRSAWIAMFIELGLILAIQYRYKIKSLIKPSLIITFITLPVALYMIFFSSQSMVTSSNQNRLMLIDIALDLWQDHPLIGWGAGTFYDFVSKDVVYILEFGSALDAHGFVWKILPELGIFGLVSFILLIGYIIYRLIKTYYQTKDLWWKYLILTSLIFSAGSLAFQFFQVSYFLGRLWLPLGIGLVITKLAQSYENSNS